MNRSTFAALLAGGAAAACVPSGTFARELEGSVTTQQALFAALPPIAAGEWTRIILGSGAQYQKQIGAGTEHLGDGGRLLYLETQVGSPGGSCNPNSMRKAYLRRTNFGSLLDAYPLLANIGRTENMIYRFGDSSDRRRASGDDTTLRLLDERYLYDPCPLRVVSVAAQKIHAASRAVTATHVVAEVAGKATAAHPLHRVELWHHPAFPFGVVQYRATLVGLDPFEARVYAFGNRFDTLLPLPLARVREMTANGQYGFI